VIKQDIRDYQILFLSSFLILGISNRDWTLRPDLIVAVTLSSLATQWAINYLSSRRNRKEDSERRQPGFRSAIITSLSLSLLLRADNWAVMALAGILAIASKFIFNYRGKHFFNPANFGIIGAILLTNNAWVSPGQWGEDWWYAMLFLGAGGLILNRIGRWDTTVAFLGSYALLEAIRNFWLGWTWDVWLHRLSSGSLLLFALFMITDPRSIPNARIGRIIWSVAIASLAFILRNQFYIHSAVFWSLFALAPFTIVLDRIFAAPRFTWQQESKKSEAPLAIVAR